MPEAQSGEGRPGGPIKAWRNWLLMFTPLFVLMYAASEWFGFIKTVPILTGVLIAALFYQRAVNGRSWRSIMWGVHTRPD
jgi:hypothetical protein